DVGDVLLGLGLVYGLGLDAVLDAGNLFFVVIDDALQGVGTFRHLGGFTLYFGGHRVQAFSGIGILGPALVQVVVGAHCHAACRDTGDDRASRLVTRVGQHAGKDTAASGKGAGLEARSAEEL